MLNVSNLQTALAALPSDVLKSCQMKLTVKKLTTNTVGVTQPDISVTLDTSIAVPVFGLWGETYFPESGETISTSYARVIFQESGTYTVTVALPFVDVVNGSTVTLNAISTPTVVDQTDGTITVVLPQAQASITNIVAGSRLLVYNDDKNTEVFNDIVTGTSFSLGYANGTTFSAGDTVRVTIEYQSGVTAKQTFRQSAVATSSGWAVLAEQVDDDVYIGYGHDGSTLTGKFEANYAQGTIKLKDGLDPLVSQLYAWFVYSKRTSAGIYTGDVLTVQNSANLILSNSVLLDNMTSASVVFDNTRRLYRKDGAYPVKRPPTGPGGGAIGGGVQVNYTTEILIAETGVSGLTPAETATMTQIKNMANLIPATFPE